MPDPTLNERLAQVASSVLHVRAKHDTCLLCGVKPPPSRVDRCSIVRGVGYTCDVCLPDEARDKWVELRRRAGV